MKHLSDQKLQTNILHQEYAKAAPFRNSARQTVLRPIQSPACPNVQKTTLGATLAVEKAFFA
jgi:hypothetical protein